MGALSPLFSKAVHLIVLSLLVSCPTWAITFGTVIGTAGSVSSSTNTLNINYMTGGVMQIEVQNPTMLGCSGFLFCDQVTINVTNNTGQTMTGYRVELCLTSLCPQASTTADTGSLGDTLYTGASLTWPTVQVTNGTADVRRFTGGSLVQSALGSVTFYVTINSFAVINSFSLIVNPEFAPANESSVPEPSTYAMLALGGAAIVFARLRRRAKNN